MTNRKKFNKPYYFQTIVEKNILNGQDVILQAPTGSGKTRAAIQPALKGFERNPAQYPQKMVYGVPMRVLASSFMDEFRETARTNSKWLDNNWQPHIQTGERPEDRQFEGQLTFATVDQILAGFLNMPYGLPRSRDNMNAGAVIGSYLVFDEFHLYPTGQMMLTVLAMLKMLKGVSRFTLMTATFSPVMLRAIADELGAVVVADGATLPDSTTVHFNDIDRLNQQHRTWLARDGVLNASHIQQALDDHQVVLCICNRVDRAQEIFANLQPDNQTDTLLLHSRFYQNDRAALEQKALTWLGKDDTTGERHDDGRKKVIIATQVVEVGLDISADMLLTECAPAASLIQRAGRCVRWGGQGEVHVFQPPADQPDSDAPNYAPYINDGFDDVCRRTWEALTSADFHNSVLDYAGEQRLIKLGHDAHDREHLVDDLATRLDTRMGEIIECIQNRDDGMRNHLIRENSSASLFIMDTPDQHTMLTEQPHRLESFSVSRGRIFHEFEQMLTTYDGDAPYLLKGADQQESEDFEGRNTTVYKWLDLRSEQDVFNFWEFVAHPLAISYDSRLGLRWHNPAGQPARPSPDNKRQSIDYSGYNADTYVQHIDGLHQAYSSYKSSRYRPLREDYHFALLALARRITPDITFETLDTFMRLTLALHDVGKLNQPWQMWAQARHHLYAETIDTDVDVPTDGTPLAHTFKGRSKFAGKEAEYETRFSQMKIPPRGNHSVEGAEAVRQLIWQVTNQDRTWFSIVTAAICRHHTPTASTAGAFQMADNTGAALLDSLRTCGFQEQADDWLPLIQREFQQHSPWIQGALQEISMTRGNYNKALMYLLFVRILRLADQRSSTYIHELR